MPMALSDFSPAKHLLRKLRLWRMCTERGVCDRASVIEPILCLAEQLHMLQPRLLPARAAERAKQRERVMP